MSRQRVSQRFKCITLVWAGLLASVCGCDQFVYGTGKMFAYNDGPTAVQMHLAGPRTYDFPLVAGASTLHEIAQGAYTLTIQQADGAEVLHAIDVQERGVLVIGNPGKTCFARADVSGMYVSGRPPLRIIETYGARPVLQIASEVQVLPGQSLPEKKPKSPFTFQRLAAVPCSSIDDTIEVERALRKIK